MQQPTLPIKTTEPPRLPATRERSAPQMVKDWTKSVMLKKLEVDKQLPISLMDMQKIADLAMYDGLIVLHDILQLPNTEEVTRMAADGSKFTATISNVPYKVSAANGVVAAQRYLLERTRGEKSDANVGTTIIFEESQQITSSDGSKTITSTKKTIGKAGDAAAEPEEVELLDVSVVEEYDEDGYPKNVDVDFGHN